MLSLTDINARLASIQTGITGIPIYIDKIYTYLDTLVTHTVSPLLIPLQSLRKFWKISEKGYSITALICFTKQSQQRYMELLQSTPDKHDSL